MTKKDKIDIPIDSDTSNEETPDKSETENETKETTPDRLEELEEKLRNAELEAKQSYERFLRVSADFENYKKRSSREVSEFKKYANESILSELLCVVDNLERAISSTTTDDKVNSCIVDGINMTLNEFKKVFENYGVKPIESLCKPFDPNFHQAMMQEESKEHPDNTVISEFQKGYTIHDRLLRPSMVVVSKAKTDNNS
ncbi:MAG: nucleotide exchange factor GrpE [Proteobacteria bacterium]|nr:nucleotide exchange factor GrpE [Pseudomonadota bacterium]MBU4036629.1 nucleotide exchange factor GrpE [Pseudomonadota bacterium]